MNHNRTGILFLFIVFILIFGFVIAFVLPMMAKAHSQAAVSQSVIKTVNIPDAGTRYYVAKSGDGSDGSSWSKAFPNVQDALAVAVDPSEIWVAEGVYYPDEGIGQVINMDQMIITFSIVHRFSSFL